MQPKLLSHHGTSKLAIRISRCSPASSRFRLRLRRSRALPMHGFMVSSRDSRQRLTSGRRGEEGESCPGLRARKSPPPRGLLRPISAFAFGLAAFVVACVEPQDQMNDYLRRTEDIRGKAPTPTVDASIDVEAIDGGVTGRFFFQ